MAGFWADPGACRQPSAHPQPGTAARPQIGVPRRVLDVLVPEPFLNGASVLAVIGEGKPTGMLQPMGYDVAVAQVTQ